MSNLRIKNKKLKRELEFLKMQTIQPRFIHERNDVMKLRSSLMLTEKDMDYIPQCVEQVIWMLCEEVKNYIKVKKVNPDLDDSRLPFSMLLAELSIVRKND